MPPVDIRFIYKLESTAVIPSSPTFDLYSSVFASGLHKGEKCFLNVSCIGFGLPLKILSFRVSFWQPIDEANSSRNSGMPPP
jgi:hypothetical protein